MKYADQGGMKNYLGKQPMVDAPKYWRSGPDAPPTELAYITDAEKDMIMKANLHGSLSQGPNEGPSGIMSLDSQGDYTADRSPAGRAGRSRQGQAQHEQHMKSILTGQKNIGQTSKVSDRVRQGAVPEYVNTPGGLKYLGSAYKDTGRRSFLSRLFGGSNRYGYSPVRGLKNLRTRGVPGQRGFEYYSDDEEIGETKPGYGGRILGGLMSLLTGIPLVGGALGTAYDYGKGIFGPKQRDMSEFNRLGLFGVPKGTYDFDPNAKINQSTNVPMARMDPWSKPISRSPMSDPMWSNREPITSKGPMGDPMWNNRGIVNALPKNTANWFDTHPATGESVMTPGFRDYFVDKNTYRDIPSRPETWQKPDISPAYSYIDTSFGNRDSVNMKPYSYSYSPYDGSQFDQSIFQKRFP